jgi:type I restriction enzyme S subunit
MWTEKKLSEICEINLGKTPSRKHSAYWDKKKTGNNKWVSIADLTKIKTRYISDTKEYISDKGASLFNPVKKGTLLMSFKLSIGKLAYTDCDLYTNEAIVALPIKNNKEICINFLYYYLTFYDWDKETENDFKLKGRTLNKAKLKEIKIKYPPLLSQQKIVAKLDKIFAEIDKATSAAETNIKNAELLFISYLNKILNYKNGWKKSKLKDICIFINRGISPSYTNQGGTLILNQKCVRNHKVTYDLGRRHDEIKKEIKKERLLIQGDVLVNSTGVGTLGRVAQVKDIIKEKITVDSHVTILRPNTEFLYYKFFGYIMISIEDEIKNSGEGTSGQTELSRIKLSEKFIIKYPEDQNLQKLIVSKIDLIKETSISIKKIMEKKIIELNLLKNSILRQALNGELIKAA